jgi:hypothetical protein
MEQQHDPDNMQFIMPELTFLREGQFKSRIKRILVSPVLLPWAPHACCIVVRNVLKSSEMQEIIANCNQKGFSLALMPKPHRRRAYQPDLRDSYRCMFDSVPLAEFFGSILAKWIPSEIDGAQFVGINERCRVLNYQPGQIFPPHEDIRYVRPKGHPQAGAESKLTLQFYLNDVPAAHGGATTFLGPADDQRVEVQPEAGSVLIFLQRGLRHEGSLVNNGEKYTLRTEAMYLAPARK